MDEEVVLLEEQLASANADIEQLQARLANAEALAATRDAELTETRRNLDEARSAADARSVENEALAAAAGAAEERAFEDARRYRDLVLAREPELPADLIIGDTISAIDEAVTQARQTVAQVRQHIEQQAQVHRVPAGAPARSGPDLSGLSPSEKIRHGLGGS